MSRNNLGRNGGPRAPTPDTDLVEDSVAFELDGVAVTIERNGDSLLGALRDQLGSTSVKDGCSPQGQCGCCTVLVDGAARVACVTPAKRIAGRKVTTLDGVDPEKRQRWAEAFCATGASQCGFCTPGILMRLEALSAKGMPDDDGPVKQALLAHLCRCTGWQTIIEAWHRYHDGAPIDLSQRDFEAASQRATLEGGTRQLVSTDVVLGSAGFAADTAPDDALVAVRSAAGEWVVADSLFDARTLAGKVQGRRTTVEHGWPLDLPEGDWAATLRTTWVEPAYLETDASWATPDGQAYSPLANAGAFGAKLSSPVNAIAEELAQKHQRPVLAMASREDATLLGAKRPPVAGGIRPDGTGVIRVVATPGISEAIQQVAPGLVVEEVDVDGPETSADIRGAGWLEAMLLMSAIDTGPAVSDASGTGTVTDADSGWVHLPDGGSAQARLRSTPDGLRFFVSVRCGRVLDEVVLRSYCIGAVHMAWSWLRSEALTVDDEGAVHDLTVRSFGVLRAVDMPEVEILVEDQDSEPTNGSDAVFAAAALAGWSALGFPGELPAREA